MQINKNTALVAGILILIYFMFTSGLVFELTKNNQTKSLDTPYSIVFSNERIGFVGFYNEDDIECAKWVVYNTKELPIQIDYLGVSLIIDYDGYNRWTYDDNEERYLFLHTWNIENNKLVYGRSESTREYEPLPNLSNAIEMHRQGKAVVYYMSK